MEVEAVKLLAAGGCMAIGAIAAAFSEGMLASKAMEGIGRNPEAQGKIFPSMIVAMSIIESTAIFTLVIALIVLFAA